MIERRDPAADDRSLGALFADLVNQIGQLVRQEIALARTEMTTRATIVGRQAAMVGAGGALLYAAFLVLLFAVVLGLVELGLDAWLAALVVAVVVGVAGAALVVTGRERLRTVDLAPRTTIDSLKDDADWAKERLP